MNMSRAITAAGALLAGALLGAASPPAAPQPVAGQCFAMHDVGNHRIGGDRDLYLNVTGRGVYRLTMANNCLSGAMSSDPLIVRSPNSQSICRPLDLDLSIKTSGGIARPCIVASIARLTPAEVAALSPARRP